MRAYVEWGEAVPAEDMLAALAHHLCVARVVKHYERYLSKRKEKWELTSSEVRQYQQKTCLQRLHIICAQPASRSINTLHIGHFLIVSSLSQAIRSSPSPPIYKIVSRDEYFFEGLLWTKCTFCTCADSFYNFLFLTWMKKSNSRVLARSFEITY